MKQTPPGVHRYICTRCFHSFRHLVLIPGCRPPKCPRCGAPSRHTPLGDLSDDLKGRIGI